jgi:hypothetical protein
MATVAPPVFAGAVTVNTNENNQNNDPNKYKGQDEETEDTRPKDGLIASTVTLLGVGLVAPLMVMKCQKPSAFIFAGAGAMYVANEMGLFGKFLRGSKRVLAYFLGRGDEDKQIEALEAAKDETKNAAEAAKKKAQYAKYAAMGMMAAAAVAMFEDKFMATTPCFGQAAPTVQNLHFEKDFRPDYYVANAKTDHEAYVLLQDSERFIKGETKSTSLDQWEKIKTFPLKGMAGFLLGAAKMTTAALFPEVLAKDKKKEEKDNSMTYKMGALGLGLAGAAVIAWKGKAILDSASEMLNKGITRAILFGGFGGAAYLAATQTDAAAKKLDERAEEYGRLANELREKTAQQANLTNAKVDQKTTSMLTQSVNGTGIGNSSDQAVCFEGKGDSYTQDVDCSCRSSNTCSKIQLPNVNSIPGFDPTGVIAQGTSALGATANSLFSGNTAGAETNGAALSQNAAKIRRLRKALQKNFNQQNVKKGGKAIDFDKAERGAYKKLARDIEATFNKLPQKHKDAVMALSPAIGAQIGANQATASKGKAKTNGVSISTGKGLTNVGGAKGLNQGKGNAFDFKFDDGEEDQSAAEAAAIAEALAAENPEDFVMENEDISSNRHKKSFQYYYRALSEDRLPHPL